MEVHMVGAHFPTRHIVVLIPWIVLPVRGWGAVLHLMGIVVMVVVVVVLTTGGGGRRFDPLARHHSAGNESSGTSTLFKNGVFR